MRPDGRFTLVWVALGLLGRRFGADGEPEGEEFQINQQPTNSLQTAAVAGTPDGGFVAAWDLCHASAADAPIPGHPLPGPPGPPPRGPSPCDVHARLFGAEAQPLTDELAVSPDDGRSNTNPVVAAENGRGYFAVTWHDCLLDSCRVSTRLYNPKGLAAPHAETIAIGENFTSPSLAVGPAGFMVVFTSAACTDFFPRCNRTAPSGIYAWPLNFRR
jgi:hypothetical protein